MRCPAAGDVKQVAKRILDDRGNAVGSVLSKLPHERISQGWRDVLGWPDLWCALSGWVAQVFPAQAQASNGRCRRELHVVTSD